MTQKSTHNFAVIGMGMNGMLNTICLAGLRLASGKAPSVCIMDKDAEPLKRFELDNRTIALSGFTKNLLSELKIDIEAEPLGVIDYIYTFEKSTKPILEFAKEQNNNEPIGWIVKGGVLLNALYKKMQELSNIEIKNGYEITELASTADIAIINGGQVGAELCVVCDGKASPSAKLLGVKRYGSSYNQKALSFVIEHEAEHKNIAVEQFTPNGPFATLPLANKNQSGVVWSLNGTLADALLAMPQHRLVMHLNEECKRLKNIGFVKQIVSKPRVYPLNISVLSKMYCGRFYFAGDAYNAIHPVAGQAFNMGVKDAAILKEAVQGHLSLGLDAGLATCLNEAANARIQHHLSLNIATHFLVKLYSNANPLTKLIRTAGLDIFNQISPLKNLAFKNASGM